MEEIQAKKFFAWLMAIFPTWQPDSETLKAWRDAMPSAATFEQSKAAVYSLMSKNPTPFPPGIFEILKELGVAGQDLGLDARKAFAYLWEYAGNRGTRLPAPIDLKFAREVECMVAGGGGFGQLDTSEKPWIEKRFIEIYTGMAQEKRREQLLSLGTTQEVPLLEGGE